MGELEDAVHRQRAMEEQAQREAQAQQEREAREDQDQRAAAEAELGPHLQEFVRLMTAAHVATAPFGRSKAVGFRGRKYRWSRDGSGWVIRAYQDAVKDGPGPTPGLLVSTDARVFEFGRGEELEVNSQLKSAIIRPAEVPVIKKNLVATLLRAGAVRPHNPER